MSVKAYSKRFSSLIAFALATIFITFNSYAQAPQAPAAGGDAALAEKGKDLFFNKYGCNSCHNVHKQEVGPALKEVYKRKPVATIKAFIKNPSEWVAKDPYYADLAKKMGSVMKSFPDIKDEEVDAIIAYIKVEEVNIPKPPPGDTTNGGPSATVQKSDNSTTILVLTTVTLVLVAVTLFVLLAVIRKHLRDRQDNMAEADKELVNQKFDIMAVLRSKLFIAAISFLFVCVAVRTCWVGMISIGIEQGYAPKQPIPFSHKLHAGERKIDCNYCHTGVRKGKQAGIPSVNICMNCHNSIKEGPTTGKNAIARITLAYEKNEPIQWVRVHNLPDLAYFNHSQHTKVAGLDCKECHGQVDTMSVLHQHAPLTMGWCINCHRQTVVKGSDTTEHNQYYDRLLRVHQQKKFTVDKIGGLECAKCHY